MEGKRLAQVEPLSGSRRPIRISQGVLNGQSHVGRRELCDDAAIDKLDHRMYHALGMDHNLHLLGLELEQPARFDHLERLVHQVAESIVILGPIRQVGCFSASSGVTSVSSLRVRPRNGPPDDVRITRRTSWRAPAFRA